jgi:hypothetical protein
MGHPDRPPLGLMVSAPSRWVMPLSIASALHPGLVIPKWSMARYCER